MSDRITARVREHLETSAYAQKLGIVCDLFEDDRAVYSMAFREDNVTIADVVHGGAICSLADVAATGAAWSAVTEPERFRGITIDLSLSFVAAARGCALTADARVVKRGGTVCFIDVDVRSPGRELVARCKVVYKLSRVESPEERMAAVFAGRSATEQMQILARLERVGAGLYRSFAEAATDDAIRNELVESADREEANAAVLGRVAKR